MSLPFAPTTDCSRLISLAQPPQSLSYGDFIVSNSLAFIRPFADQKAGNNTDVMALFFSEDLKTNSKSESGDQISTMTTAKSNREEKHGSSHLPIARKTLLPMSARASHSSQQGLASDVVDAPASCVRAQNIVKTLVLTKARFSAGRKSLRN